MKKGDKVRFLSETGGGIVAGFQGKNIVLVQDADGFEIPMSINEVVVVDDELDRKQGRTSSAATQSKPNSTQTGCTRQAVYQGVAEWRIRKRRR